MVWHEDVVLPTDCLVCDVQAVGQGCDGGDEGGYRVVSKRTGVMGRYLHGVWMRMWMRMRMRIWLRMGNSRMGDVPRRYSALRKHGRTHEATGSIRTVARPLMYAGTR